LRQEQQLLVLQQRHQHGLERCCDAGLQGARW